MVNLKAIDSDNVAGAPQGPDDEIGWPDLSRTPVFADDALLSHYLNSLLVKSEFLSELVPTGNRHREMLARVRSEIASFETDKLLNPRERINHAWIKAFRLELLLALVEPSERLIPELEARLVQAEEEKVPAAVVGQLRGTVQQITQQQSTQTGNPADQKANDCRLRSMLIDIIRKIQWQQTKKYACRNLQREATKKIIIAASGSFLLVLVPYISIFYLYYSHNYIIDPFKNWIGYLF